MNRHDYVPSKDVLFDIWQHNMLEKVEANQDAWGIPAERIASLKTQQTLWAPAFLVASNNRTRSGVDVSNKTDIRKKYEKDLRVFTGEWLSKNSRITNADRISLGITVRLDTQIKAPVPESYPFIFRVDFSMGGQHTIHYVDSETMRKAKPKGVHGCELWIKKGGEMPVLDSEFTFVALDTRTPYLLKFDYNERGLIVYYRMRWFNKRGQVGPWSEIVRAIVAP